MVGGIAFSRPPAVMPLVSRLEWPQASESVRCEQLFRNGVYNRFLLRLRKRTYGQGKRKNLIGAERSILLAGRSVDHVIAAPPLRVPEFLEIARGLFRKLFVALSGTLEPSRKSRHGMQRVDPERIDLYWLADPGRHHPIAHLRVHPG